MLTPSQANSRSFPRAGFIHSFIQSNEQEPHVLRSRKILAAHPEIRSLYGNDATTLISILGLVTFQTGMAIVLSQSALGWNFLAAYCVGAVLNHALFVMIHECTHNLVLGSTRWDKLAGIFANLPIVFPSAISFRKYHLVHHRHQGEMEMDADLPGHREAAWVGGSAFRKILWMLFFFVVEGILRPARVKSVKLLDRWTFFNIAIELSFLGALWAVFGWKSVFYLFLSTVFSVGLHPLGARWIQEHYVFRPGQETYSYYGPANALCYNVGYHNEHHDLMMVPWSRLPKVRAMAPEFYDNLHAHHSWTGLLLRFLFDRKVTLFDRVIRPSRKMAKTAVAKNAHERNPMESTPVESIQTEPALQTT